MQNDGDMRIFLPDNAILRLNFLRYSLIGIAFVFWEGDPLSSHDRLSKIPRLAVLIFITCTWVSIALWGTGVSTARAWQEAFPVVVNNRFAAPQANSSKVIHSRLSGFGIPFRIDNSDGKYVEVQLYKSIDQGRSWEFHDRQQTSGTEFPFKSNGEGEYWFAMKILDRDRRLVPEGDPTAELKVMIDLTKPELEFAVKTDPAGRIVCQWQASDRFLDLSATQLQYRVQFSASNDSSQQGRDSQWQNVALNPPASVPGGIYTDQLAFWPDTSSTNIQLRMAVKDLAGNFAVAGRQTVVQAPAWRASNRSTARPTDRPAADPRSVNSPENIRSMKCNDGSCELKQPASDPVVWKNAFYSKLRSQENQRLRQSTAAAQPQKPKVPAMQVGSTPEFAPPPTPEGWVINSGSGDAGASARTVVPRPLQSVAKPPVHPPRSIQKPPTHRPRTFSSPHGTASSAPPTPMPRRERSPQPSGNGYSGDVWESNVQRSGSDTQVSVGTTRSPDPTMLPIPSRSGRSTGPADYVPSNPSTFEARGDAVVSSSSTQFPFNQYRGLAHGKPPVNPDAQVAPGVPPSIFQPLSRTASTDSANARPSDRARVFNSGFTRPGRVAEAGQRAVETQFASRPGNVGRPSINGPTKSNTQIISTRRFRLSYDINAIDPSGVGRVDLWITEDQGRSWQLWGNDPDRTSPFPVEVKNEGLFGFRVVIHSRDGLTGEGPSSGDDADMWVRVDTQSPLAQITSVPYGRGKEVGRLVINYRVADPFLTLRPVRISYSRAPQGPWTIIEDNLRNEGRYLWKVDRAVPDRIFLRIEAMDQAGNTGTHVLSQFVDVSGLVPRGTIRSVEPVGVR